MATKKSKRSTSSKKSVASETAKKQTKSQVSETPEIEEVVEVVEIEAPVADDSTDSKQKPSIMDRLNALRPAALVAELLGTFVLTAIIIKLAENSNFGLLAIALVLTVLVIVFGKISGAHLNPAITVANWINKRFDGVKTIAYIVAQVLGAVLAFFVLTWINNASFDYDHSIKQGLQRAGITEQTMEKAGGYEKWLESVGGKDTVANQLGISKTAPKLYQASTLVNGKEWVALIAEVIGSIIFGFGVAFATLKKKGCAVAGGLAVGVSLIAGLTIAGSTAILNPAVATVMGVFALTGSNVIVSAIWTTVVYVLGPIAGMSLGFYIYKLLRNSIDSDCEDCCAK